MKMRIFCQAMLSLSLLLFAAQVQAQIVDFETDGGGAPSGPTIASNEYAAVGLLIEDSQAPAGMSTLNDTHPANVGTPIDGKYVNVGAFNGVDTFIELMFPAGTDSLGFHWATGANATEIEVSLFDSSNTQIGATLHDLATDTFVNNAGFEVPAGTFSTASATAIHRVLIADQVGGTRGLILDNVRFQQVPEPASFLLAACGVVGLFASRRRKC